MDNGRAHLLNSYTCKSFYCCLIKGDLGQNTVIINVKDSQRACVAKDALIFKSFIMKYFPDSGPLMNHYESKKAKNVISFKIG